MDSATEVSHLGNRLGELVGVLQERLDVPQGNPSVNDGKGPRYRYQEVTKVPDKVHHGEDQDRKELGLPGGLVVLVVLLSKLLFFIRFLVEGPNDGVPGVGFFDLTVDFPQGRLLPTEQPLGGWGNKGHDHQAGSGESSRKPPGSASN